jgi:type 1 glutamine amidotransferase
MTTARGRIGLFCLGAFCAGASVAAPSVLIFHKENGYIHTAGPTVLAALKSNWASHGVTVESTIDSLAFTAQNLARFDAIVFFNTNYRNGPLLARAQEAAFEEYVRAGGAFVGLHSAIPLNGVAEEKVWPWYASLYGARFRSHAPYRSAPMVIADSNHFSTRGLPARFSLQDEWYALQVNPRTVPGIRILATADETGFQADSYMGGDHPVSWSRTFEGGRAWVTVIGHDMGAFSNASFMTHVRNGVLWAAGADSGTTALSAPRAATRGKTPATGLSYVGKHGEVLEIDVDGRRVDARRVLP